MVEQYPRYVYALSGGEAELGDDGIFRAVEPVLALVCKGRDETNGKGTTITTADGRAIQFAATVYMPKDTKHIAEGAEIVIATKELTAQELETPHDLLQTGAVTIISKCYRFSRGQLNCRMWI